MSTHNMTTHNLSYTGFSVFVRSIFHHSIAGSMLCVCLVFAPLTLPAHGQAHGREKTALDTPSLPIKKIAATNFGADAPWYEANIPFLEIDDPEIEQIYYYRWKLYRSHIREIGEQGTTVTEFLPDVPWARHPYTDLNDSSSFHLLEGRWLRNPEIVDSLIDHLYSGGGNDRHFSESIASATWSTTLVTGDTTPAIRHLDSMQYVFNAWDDHLDWSRNLYWIEPISDATEYTIASIDASGAGFTDKPSKNDWENGFLNRFAFRPSINSYQFANATAIAEIAAAAGHANIAAEYSARAEKIRVATLAQLWNEDLGHFTDRYQRSTHFVKAGDFVRGRELVGYNPWLYELPRKDVSGTAMAKAWKHILSSSELAGPYGLRTVEPSYPKYMVQYRYDRPTGKPECEWNGPSWPFQTSQTLGALANLLNDYPQTVITSADYLKLLRQYTHQHFLSPGHPDLQEDYNPDTGMPIVGLARSHHYNHSTYIDLILSGLIGIRPRADDIFELNPLIPKGEVSESHPIRYFLLDNLAYHGHTLKIVYDQNGSHYRSAPGLTVYVDGKLALSTPDLKRAIIALPKARKNQLPEIPKSIDVAINPGVSGFPVATASSTDQDSPDQASTGQASTNQAGSPSEAIDGRLWFFPEIPNGWSPARTASGKQSWFSIDLGKAREFNTVDLYFLDDRPNYQAPTAVTLEYRSGSEWQSIPRQLYEPHHPIAGGLNHLTFPAIQAQQIRITIEGPPAPATFRLIEAEAFDRK